LAGIATGIPVGNAPDSEVRGAITAATHGGLHTTHTAVGNTFSVGGPGPAQRITITADPSAPNWIKDLVLPAPPGPPFNLNEFLTVGPGPSWTDWHQSITTLGWEWVLGTGIVTVGGLPVALGTRDDLDSNGTFETISFLFDPALDPGTELDIQKQIQCAVNFTCSLTGSIEVRQFPTIAATPEPGVLLLLAAGLAGFAASRRRRR
jgi:hypothetical protein